MGVKIPDDKLGGKNHSVENRSDLLNRYSYVLGNFVGWSHVF